jgi:hypothetical protein
MTLITEVATGDGIVIASDSRTTRMITGKPTRVASDFTHKLFEVGRCAVATSGFGFISGRNIASHIADFVDGFVPDGKSAEDVTNELANFMQLRLESHFAAGLDLRPTAGTASIVFLVAGFNGAVGELREIALPSRTIRLLHTTETGGLAWLGQRDVVDRIIKGVDPVIDSRIAGDSNLTDAMAKLKTVRDGLEYVINPLLMNIQDAVDFVTLLIRTTIDVQRLTNGTLADVGAFPGVGGPIEICLVTASQGFQWIQRTEIKGERPSGLAELN